MACKQYFYLKIKANLIYKFYFDLTSFNKIFFGIKISSMILEEDFLSDSI